MRTVLSIVLLAVVTWSVEAYSLCYIRNTNQITKIYPDYFNLDFPCSYAAAREQCGEFFVNATVENDYIRPYFYIKNVYLSVEKNGKIWEGRTNHSWAVKFYDGEVDAPFEQTGSELDTDKIFNIERNLNTVGKVVYAFSKKRFFSIHFRPFLGGIAHSETYGQFVYSCPLREVEPFPFPQRMCESKDAEDVKREALALGFATNETYDEDARYMTFYYYVFTDADVKQATPACEAAVTAMTQVCPNERKRVRAIQSCYKLFYSERHRQCVHYSGNLAGIFSQCVRFVCSNYRDYEACQHVGRYMELCSTLPGLAKKVEGCFSGLFG